MSADEATSAAATCAAAPPRHVALFTQDMSGGGAFTTVFASYATALALAGVERIDLVTVRGDPRRSDVPFPAASRPVPLAGGGAAGALGPLVRYLEREQPEVLIPGPIVPNLAACLAKLRARRWRGRLVLSHHHPVGLARSQSWKNSPALVRLLYPLADASFAVAPAVRDEAIRAARLDPARVACIPVPVPPVGEVADAAPHPWLRPEARDGPLFLTVGRIEPVKNLPVLVDAFERAAAAVGGRLLIVGDGSARPALEARLRDAPLGRRIALTGRVPSPLLYYRNADVFVLGSIEEGYGLVLLEAMREGLPVISTDAAGGGPRFLLADGAAGRLVPANDAAALAGAMADLGTDIEARRRLAAAAACRVTALAPARIGRLLGRFLASGAAATPERG